jgi:predicted amidohydrolase/NH3-dependent NAD+ synthetase
MSGTGRTAGTNVPQSAAALLGLGVADALTQKPWDATRIERNTQGQNTLLSPFVTVATCNLNQWALDFTGNKRRILESIKLSEKKGARYRLGPELEICGYSCEDHFYEKETTDFSWKILGEILEETAEIDMIIDLSMPIIHHGVRYNCRVFCLAGKILLIRPKMWLAEDGNYREGRWFTGWHKDKLGMLEDHVLPEEIQMITNQKSVKFGVGIIETADGRTIASEVCEELFTAESLNILLGLEGVEIISNGSGSHFQMGKQQRRHKLIEEASKKNGGVYMYSNLLGCDGNRLVFDGNGMIYMNSQLLAVGEHLSFQEVEIVTATINLNDIIRQRASVVSHGIQADQRDVHLQRINLAEMFKGVKRVEDFHLASTKQTNFEVTKKMDVPTYEMEYEMGLCMSRYLWDYMIRSGVFGGVFLPLSGGVDSSSTAMVVYMMCDILVNIIQQNEVTEDKERLRTFIINRLKERVLMNYDEYLDDIKKLDHPRKLAYIILHTCNMPTKNNTAEIKGNAELLAQSLGCFHTTVPIEDAFASLKNMVKRTEFFNFKDTLPEVVNKQMGTMIPTQWQEPVPEVEKAKEALALAQAQRALTEAAAQVPAQAQAVQAAQAGGRPFSAAPVKAKEDLKDLRDQIVSLQQQLLNKSSAGPDPSELNIPRYKSTGGDWQENLAIQNIQARIRMITAYYMTQILPLYRYTINVLHNKDILGITWSEYVSLRDDAIQQIKASDPALANVPDEDIDFREVWSDVKYPTQNDKTETAEAIRKVMGTLKIDPGNLISLKYKNLEPNSETYKTLKLAYDRLYKFRPPAISTSMKNRKTDDRLGLLVDSPIYKYASPALIVLASSNADEALRGFFTKYDAGSADLNPIGSFSKTELRAFLKWCIGKFKEESPKYNFSVIQDILDTVASPELTPEDEVNKALGKNAIQDDEIEIQLTYGDLYDFLKYRKNNILGPYGIFDQMCADKLGKTMYVVYPYGKSPSTTPSKELEVATPKRIADKVGIMFKWYNTNRHKMTILTPSIHATSYSPDDNRHDERPFLYANIVDSYQMKKINARAAAMEADETIKNKIKEGETQLVIDKKAVKDDEIAQLTAKVERLEKRSANRSSRSAVAQGGRYSNTRNRRQQKSKTRRQRI